MIERIKTKKVPVKLKFKLKKGGTITINATKIVGVKKDIIRKVCLSYGRWGLKTDFVLEPVCGECEEEGKECEICENYIYIKKVEKEKLK